MRPDIPTLKNNFTLLSTSCSRYSFLKHLFFISLLVLPLFGHIHSSWPNSKVPPQPFSLIHQSIHPLHSQTASCSSCPFSFLCLLAVPSIPSLNVACRVRIRWAKDGGSPLPALEGFPGPWPTEGCLAMLLCYVVMPCCWCCWNCCHGMLFVLCCSCYVTMLCCYFDVMLFCYAVLPCCYALLLLLSYAVVVMFAVMFLNCVTFHDATSR